MQSFSLSVLNVLLICSLVFLGTSGVKFVLYNFKAVANRYKMSPPYTSLVAVTIGWKAATAKLGDARLVTLHYFVNLPLKNPVPELQTASSTEHLRLKVSLLAL